MSDGPSAIAPSPSGTVIRSADGRIRPVWRLLLFLLAGLFVLLAVQALTALGRKLSPQLFGSVAGYILADAGLVLLSWLFLRFLDRRGYRTLGLWFYPQWWREFLSGLIGGVGLLAVIVGVLVALSLVHYQGWAAGWSVVPRLASLALFFLVAATFEELVFRGYPFQRLIDSVGELGAILILSVLFGAAHLQNPEANALSTANTVLAGIWLAVAYLKTRALWLPIALHWAWNFFLGPVFSLPVSGIPFEPRLFVTEIGGPDWLSGGAYGPEGSMIATAGLAAMTIGLALTGKIRPSQGMATALE